MSFSLASKHEQKQKSAKKDTKWNRARVHMRCKAIMHNASSFSLSLLDNNTDQISRHAEFLMPFIFQYLYFYTTYDILQNQAKMFNYQSQFLTFIQFSSKNSGDFFPEISFGGKWVALMVEHHADWNPRKVSPHHLCSILS